MFTIIWLIVWAIYGTPNVNVFNEGWNGWGVVLVAFIAIDVLRELQRKG